MRCTRWLVVLTGLLFLLSPTALFGYRNDRSEPIYAIPVAETEEVVVHWLEANGFHFFRQSEAELQVRIIAEKQEIRLLIDLAPHSPLATRVGFKADSGSPRESIEKLRKHLESYISAPVSPKTPPTVHIPEAVLNLRKGAVCLYADQKGGIQFAGVVIDTNGFIVCTAHDLNPGQQVKATLYDGQQITGRIIRIDAHRDLALVQVDVPLETNVSLDTGRYLLKNGEKLYAMTCASGGKPRIQVGILEGPPRRVEGLPLWQAIMHIDLGSSGSPVFDGEGRLAAIVKGRLRGTDAIGFLIPFETLVNFLGSN